MSETKLSLNIRLTVLMLFAVQSISNNSVPVFIGYMISNFFKDKNPENAQEYTAYFMGLIEGNFRVVAALGAILWGYASDRLSRKTTLQIVLFGNIFSYIMLGLSTGYWMAFIARTLGGIFSGLVPVSKALVRDVSDNSNYARLFSYSGKVYLAMGTGIGSLIGPITAGMLSELDTDALGSSFQTFLKNFPYFFSNIP